MKTTSSKTAKILLVASIVFATLASSPAMAGGRGHWGGHGHGHWHSGFSLYLGLPLFWPYYGPAYYPQPVVVAPAPQVVYVEQAQQPVAPPPVQQYWYYCGNPQGYYPNVQACPGGWQKVLPQQVR
ncbi:MAG: hypothetical protein WCD07_06740 [Burkholderiales bacterium]